MAQLRLARGDDGRAEIFKSIQGEGPMSGRVRAFIRLSGCNLHCVWCDTAYTWNWRGLEFPHEADGPDARRQFTPEQEMIATSAQDAARAIAALGAEGLVITGGEPLLQAAALTTLIDLVRAQAPATAIELETNGTIAPDAAIAARVDLFVVSPKLAHSGNEAGLALKDAALAAFAALDGAVFKFVARMPEDLDAVRALAQRFAIPAARIMIMPEGATSDGVRARARALAPRAIAEGWALSDRLHVHLFGARRGV